MLGQQNLLADGGRDLPIRSSGSNSEGGIDLSSSDKGMATVTWFSGLLIMIAVIVLAVMLVW